MNTPMNAYKVFERHPNVDNFLIPDNLKYKSVLVVNYFMSTKIMFPDGAKLLATDFRGLGTLEDCLKSHDIPYVKVTQEMIDDMKAKKIKVSDKPWDVEMEKGCYSISTIISMNDDPETFMLRE